MQVDPSAPCSMVLTKPSRFLQSIQTEPIKPGPGLIKQLPFTLNSSSELPCNLLKFANAPKLGPNCHKLGGYLDGLLSLPSEELRNKDHSIRQTLAGLLELYEAEKYKIGISENVSGDRDTSAGRRIKAVEKVCKNLSAPILKTLIFNFTNQAKITRALLRDKAATNTITRGV